MNPLRLQLAALPLLCVTAASAVAQGAAAPRSNGFTAGIAVGVSRVSLGGLVGLPAVRTTDVALSWKVGYRTSERTAVMLSGASSPYRYTGPGRPRRRAFEGIFPTLEFSASDAMWVSGGVGLNLDAPVFYDVRGGDREERRFWRGLGTLLSVGYAPFSATPQSFASHVYVEGRWQRGSNNVPQGRQRGQTAAILLGVRR